MRLRIRHASTRVLGQITMNSNIYSNIQDAWFARNPFIIIDTYNRGVYTIENDATIFVFNGTLRT